MPLPDNGTPWPPPEFADALAQMHTWGAWYSGNPDHLSRAYQAIGHQLVNTPNVRPSQLRGGVVGTFARWFWGQPVPPGEKRVKLHVPIAADLAATSADLLFSEPITLTTEDKDKAAQEQLDKLLDDQLHATLLESAELCAALSGVYLRAVWDKEVRPEGPWLAPVHADAAIPDWRYGRLTAVTFVQELRADTRVVLRHLERHEPGKILHGLYEGTRESLGRAVPLDDAPQTKGLKDVDTGVDSLTAVYIPNIRPNRQWRHLPACAPFGRSDFDGVEGFMDALDETYTSWMRDIRLAKARIIVPEVFLQDRGPGKGAMFDPDREAYEGLGMIPAADGSTQLTLQQFEIRVEEHQKSALDFVGRIVTTAGYSQQTFGLTGDVAVTATEVAARERKSLITRDKKIKYVRPQLQAILWTLAKLGQVHFGWPAAPSDAPTVNFPDAVQQDPASLSQTLAQLEAARAASTETKVRMLHPEWDDTEVGKEVARILQEAGPAEVQNPETFTGLPGDEPPADKPPAEK
ncbi:capsid protein [Amycolatopsis eburnea]|uniref:Capsid protein n=1 Tax=Amycolatopsis eburnea TaxID=2267691 RepID=A0A427TG32_9PSEU|nr:capsid protein [Amycolatopsis eburnea]RSD21998.1 capsid protein [Amycolatopsis eburnea]